MISDLYNYNFCPREVLNNPIISNFEYILIFEDFFNTILREGVPLYNGFSCQIPGFFRKEKFLPKYLEAYLTIWARFKIAIASQRYIGKIE